MDFILCSVAFLICLALQVSSNTPPPTLAPKPIGEWHPDRYTVYPNPWVEFTRCNRQKPSGLCDVNGMLTEEQRNYLSEQREMQEVSDADGCLCNKDCGANIRIVVTVAVMKKIGPGITEYRAAAKDFADKFRPFWNLTDCSVILIVSCLDNMCYLDAGPDVITLLTANETDRIDRHIFEKCKDKQGQCVDGINKTLIEYRSLIEATKKAHEEQKNSADKIIVGVIVGVLAVGILATILVIVYRRSKRKTPKLPVNEKEEENLNAPKAV